MNVRPLRDRVLVKRIEAQEQRIGGITADTHQVSASTRQNPTRRLRSIAPIPGYLRA
jgi:co-chaperonin GroES (HSP10)